MGATLPFALDPSRVPVDLDDMLHGRCVHGRSWGRRPSRSGRSRSCVEIRQVCALEHSEAAELAAGGFSLAPPPKENNDEHAENLRNDGTARGSHVLPPYIPSVAFPRRAESDRQYAYTANRGWRQDKMFIRRMAQKVTVRALSDAHPQIVCQDERFRVGGSLVWACSE